MQKAISQTDRNGSVYQLAIVGGVSLGFDIKFGVPQEVPGLGRLAPNMSVRLGWAGVPICGVKILNACFGNVTDVCKSAANGEGESR